MQTQRSEQGQGGTNAREIAKESEKEKTQSSDEGERRRDREQAKGKRETSSRGDLRSGAALSSLNILADLISPALFQL